MEIVIAVGREAQRRKTALPSIDAELLLELTDEGHFRRLPGFDLAAWELPETCHALAFWALCQKHAAIGIDQGNSGDEDLLHER